MTRFGLGAYAQVAGLFQYPLGFLSTPFAGNLNISFDRTQKILKFVPLALLPALLPALLAIDAPAL